MKSIRILSLFALLGSSACVRIDLEMPETCFVEQGLQMISVDEIPAMKFALSEEDLSELPEGVLTDLFLTRVEMYPKNGIDNVTISLNQIVLAGCHDGSCESGDGGVIADSMGEVNIAEHVKSGPLELELKVAGDLPKEAWSTDVTACFEAAATIEASL
jgi:hypothetical protein